VSRSRRFAPPRDTRLGLTTPIPLGIGLLRSSLVFCPFWADGGFRLASLAVFVRVEVGLPRFWATTGDHLGQNWKLATGRTGTVSGRGPPRRSTAPTEEDGRSISRRWQPHPRR